jgi:tripartite-type tricarboxylate transporter receptor subunit TctC
MRRWLCIFALLGAFALSALVAPLSVATAQDYPNKPVRVIASSSAGGISDIFIRVLGDELQKKWGHPLVVDNRPGGSFNIGARACAEAAPDGYTICILPSDVLQYNRFLFKNLPYDLFKDLEPITLLFFLNQVLAVSAQLNVSTFDELAALSKAKPGTLSYSAPAVPHQIFLEEWKARTGADIVRVPFRGGGDAVNGMLTGTTPVTFIGLGNLIAHLRAGTIKGIAIDAGLRASLFPDIPTLKEINATDDVTQADFALWAPKGTPKTLIQKVHDDVVAIANEPSFRDKFVVQRGLDPVFSTPEQFAVYLQKSRVIAEATAKKGNLQPQ